MGKIVVIVPRKTLCRYGALKKLYAETIVPMQFRIDERSHELETDKLRLCAAQCTYTAVGITSLI